LRRVGVERGRGRQVVGVVEVRVVRAGWLEVQSGPTAQVAGQFLELVVRERGQGGHQVALGIGLGLAADNPRPVPVDVVPRTENRSTGVTAGLLVDGPHELPEVEDRLGGRVAEDLAAGAGRELAPGFRIGFDGGPQLRHADVQGERGGLPRMALGPQVGGAFEEVIGQRDGSGGTHGSALRTELRWGTVET